MIYLSFVWKFSSGVYTASIYHSPLYRHKQELHKYFCSFSAEFYGAEQKASASSKGEKMTFDQMDSAIGIIWSSVVASGFHFVVPVGMTEHIKKVLPQLQKNFKHKRRFLLNLGALLKLDAQ